ncbi:diguanylate cyclase [uncultured Arenimonas sp.]|uniref:sensor domain-containing diguanylate cyclase n=1 Tax=uncultured Arenimonas sp. TaxID=546226 RepID=UPI0030D7DD4E
MRVITVFLALLLAAVASPAPAQPALLDEHTSSIRLEPHLRYAVDPDGRADAAAMFARAGRGEFEPLPDGSSTFGFSDGAYWFHAEIFNSHAELQRWLLVLHYPLLDNVDIYLRYPNGRVEHMATGDTLPFSARSISYRQPNFWIDLPQRTRVEMLVRVSSRSSMQVPLVMYTPTAFAERERDAQLGIGLFYGILIALFCYNLVLWLSLRDASHFWYMFHVAGFGLVVLCLNGLSFEYLWPNSPWLANYSIPLSMAISQVAMHQFARVFLELRERIPWANRVTLAIIAFYVLMGLGSLVLEYRTVVLPMTLAVFPGALYILALTVISLRRGYAPAKIFLLAWSCLLFGTALYASVSFGILPKTFVTEYGIQIGSALEMILLSFALAYRYARLRSENETLVREHNEQLERHVARRTSELSTALEQLAEANQRLRESNRRDALTGLFNRRHFRDVFEHQMHHAAEHRQALGVLLIDLDHFKRVNDTYGHLAGDECLRWLGRCLSDTLSVHGSVIARFGGEEFVAVVPDMQGDRLMHLAEQLRVRIFSEPVRYAGNNIGISASIGAFVLHPGTGIGVDEALHRADDALYAAKDRGRNCVHAAEDITT